MAILSPGQNVQQAGMGKPVWDASEKAKEVFYIGSEVTGVDLAEVCFGSQTERLEETLVAQPAIAAVTISEFDYLTSLGIKFDAGIGHSFGELPLLRMAGSLALGDTFRLIKARAEATARSSAQKPGAMAAISGMTKEQLQDRAAHLLHDTRAGIANFNALLQQVFTGDHDRVEELKTIIENLKRNQPKLKFRLLRTGGAFHSPYHMSEAQDEFYQEAARFHFGTPKFDIMLNNARYLSELGTDNLARYLSDQLVSPVDFAGGANQLVDDGVTNFIEVGPRIPKTKYKTLSGLLKRDFNSRVKIISVEETGTSVLSGQ